MDQNLNYDQFFDGYCPESKLEGKRVRMRLNKNDFYESEATGLQIIISYPGVHATVLNFRGIGDFRHTVSYAHEKENGECLSPQTQDKFPFCSQDIFSDGNEFLKYMNEHLGEKPKTKLATSNDSVDTELRQTDIVNEIHSTLEKELVKYTKDIHEILKEYSDFSKLDISNLENFNYSKEERGLDFIFSLREHFHLNHEMSTEIYFWIINNWGGIGSFKKSETNEYRIVKFLDKLKDSKKVLTDDLFNVISSLSKIASFKNHNDYFVYDSRAIYTINWILLKSNAQNQNHQFFPMPEGRNAKLALFDLNTIINLFYKDEVNNADFKKSLFISKKDAYFVYCELIKKLSRKLIPNEKPYLLEMLLFTIADNQIFNEIKKSVNISIN